MEEEKVKIKLNIAGEAFLYSVPYGKQEEARHAEADINLVYSSWRKRFPEKSDRELLAMIAFRYADLYSAMVRESENTRTAVNDIDELLKKTITV